MGFREVRIKSPQMTHKSRFLLIIIAFMWIATSDVMAQGRVLAPATGVTASDTPKRPP